MKRGTYAIFVALPALIVFGPLGVLAVNIEKSGRWLRIKSLRVMQSVLDKAPPAGGDRG